MVSLNLWDPCGPPSLFQSPFTNKPVGMGEWVGTQQEALMCPLSFCHWGTCCGSLLVTGTWEANVRWTESHEDGNVRLWNWLCELFSVGGLESQHYVRAGALSLSPGLCCAVPATSRGFEKCAVLCARGTCHCFPDLYCSRLWQPH